MSDLFDLSNFDKYKEDNCREVKKAEGGLPIALWESYSSFANSNGGVIILGVGERQDGTWYTTGLKNADKLKRNFWNTIHDTKKVSINLLSDKNVESYEVNGDTILVIYVPRAKREQKPVYINTIYLVAAIVEIGKATIIAQRQKLKVCSVMLRMRQRI